MLKVIAAPTFQGTARITVHGQAEPAVIKVTWKHKSREEYDAWLASAASFADKGGDAAFLCEVMTDWGDVDLPFNQANLHTLLGQYAAAGGELLEAYRTDLLDSRAKN